jgi:hypothetical protein
MHAEYRIFDFIYFPHFPFCRLDQPAFTIIQHR